jgi:hypothetical protein
MNVSEPPRRGKPLRGEAPRTAERERSSAPSDQFDKAAQP